MTTIYGVALLSAVLLNSSPAYADALLDTVLKNDLNKARILLGQGSVDVKAKDSKGRTTLMHAANGGYHEIVQLLLASKADVNAVNEAEGTALMQAVFGCH